MANELLTKEEQEILERNQRYRQLMLDELFKGDQPPVSKRDFRLANEIISSSDTMALKLVELRHKQEQHKDDIEVMRDAVEFTKNIILEKKRNYQIESRDRVIDLPKEYIPKDIVKGENELEPSPLIPEEFIDEE